MSVRRPWPVELMAEFSVRPATVGWQGPPAPRGGAPPAAPPPARPPRPGAPPPPAPARARAGGADRRPARRGVRAASGGPPGRERPARDALGGERGGLDVEPDRLGPGPLGEGGDLSARPPGGVADQAVQRRARGGCLRLGRDEPGSLRGL